MPARVKQLRAWFRARRLIDEANRLGELLGDHDQTQISLRDLEIELETKHEELGAFREAQAQLFLSLSSFFDAVIRRLIHGANGKVTLDGNGIHPSVVLGGDRSTAAIQSLKVVAFDLAVKAGGTGAWSRIV